MTRTTPLSDLEKFIDGECTPQEVKRIRAELARDPSLSEAADRLDLLNRLLRSSGRDVEASAALRATIARRYSTENTPSASARRRLNRRTFFAGAGGALAAGFAALIVVPRLSGIGDAGLDPVGTFFHDFETYLLKDRALDVTETSMVQLAGWFGDRLPFALPPVASSGNSVKLIGGRLCWLMERRLASLSYETDAGPVVLYIMDANGIETPPGRDAPDIGKALSWHRSDDHTCLIWNSEQLLYVMVGTQEVHKMMSIARSLVS